MAPGLQLTLLLRTAVLKYLNCPVAVGTAAHWIEYPRVHRKALNVGGPSVMMRIFGFGERNDMTNNPMCWSTGDVAPCRSLEYWNHVLADNILRLDVSSRARLHFDGRIVGASLGRTQVYLIAAESDQKADHGRAYVAQRDDDSLCLVHMRAGAFHFEARDSTADLAVGDCILLDSKQLFRFSLPESSASLILRLTADWLRRWIPQFEDVAGTRIEGSRGWGQTLSHALWNIDPMHVAELALPCSTVADQLGALLTLAVAPRAPASTGRHELLQRVRAAMRDSYLAAELDPAAIAAQVGISKRYLHKLFASAGTTFRRELYELRFAEGERLLLLSRGSRLSQTDIALACGFCDASHFARHFRLHHGMSPGAYCAAAAGHIPQAEAAR